MSTYVSHLRPVPERAAASDPRRDVGPTLRTLAALELRKVFDTRAGRGLAIAALILGVAVAVAHVVVQPGTSIDQADPVQAIGQATGFLLSFAVLLSVTSEFSQRTALATFALVPDRARVVRAKLVAGLGLAAATAVLTVGLSMVAMLLRDATGGAGTGVAAPFGELGRMLAYHVLLALMGAGFGLLIRRTAPALAATLLLPTAWDLLVGIAPGLGDAQRWLDINTAFGPLVEGGMDATAWARVATSAALWSLIPLLVGLRLLRTAEID